MENRCRRSFEREREAISFEEQGRCHTEMAEACDINNIMAKYERGQLVDHVNKYEGQYGDFTETPGDFHQAMNMTINAKEMFMTIPADIRKKFNNHPGEFLDFTQDPANEAAMREMGLLPPAETMPAPEPAPAPASGNDSSSSAENRDPSTVPT